MQLKGLKLIIWDLDETLWNGTLSEGDVEPIKEFEEFIHNTADMGIVHSICSKNDYEKTKDKLEELHLWDLFVFPSIDWSAKGTRIKNIIDTMKLRPVNVLFVDDNPQNLNEAKFYCKDINSALPDDILNLCKEAKHAAKTDVAHKRIQQYKLLEQKEEKKTAFQSNEDFLMSCNIRVDILNDVENKIDRIHELLMRSNQLNYTKFRQEKTDLKKLINDPEVNSGYVKVKDNFGEYGIVGFFAIKDNRAVHFLFSCRTLGMLVEQYVYMTIGCPEIKVAGDVATRLKDNYIPKWINQELSENKNNSFKPASVKDKIMFKGPCDMEQVCSFIKNNDNIHKEFTYTNNNGVLIEGHNHTAQIATALTCTEDRKKEIIKDFKWFDDKMLNTDISSGQYSIVVLSMLTDGALGVYRRKKTGEMIAMCEWAYDLTDLENMSKYVSGEIFTSNIKFTKAEIERFSREYEYVNTRDGSLTIENLNIIHKIIPKQTKLILLLGSERKYLGKTTPAYKNRDKFHAMINKLIENWAQDKDNVIIKKLDNYINDDSDYTDSINHFVKSVYYRLAEDLIADIENNAGTNMKITGKMNLYWRLLLQKAAILKRKIWD